METINQRIANELNVAVKQVEAAVELLDEGATVPFIARYRKEVTGGLTDTHLRTLHERLAQLRELEERRQTILKSIAEQNRLTPQLEHSIKEAATRTSLEDLYLPYRPKRRTKATVAREAGLEPLAMGLLKNPTQTPEQFAKQFVDQQKGVKDVAVALEGARDILADVFAEDATLLGRVRETQWQNGLIQSRMVKGKEQEGEKFSDYFEFDQPLKKLPSHRVLALLRGKSLGVLRLGLEHQLDVAAEGKKAAVCESLICNHFSIQNHNRPADNWLQDSVNYAWKKKLKPTLDRDLTKRLVEKAHLEAVRVFSANLRDLLLSAPAGDKWVMGLDPGLRTGVKVALVDSTGQVKTTTTIYPHQSKNRWHDAKKDLTLLFKKYGVKLVAIGNGTGSRETDRLVNEIKKSQPELKITSMVVSEAGASVYSASEYASKELPDMDVSLRGAVSIARRLQDPLAELVKIEPKSIGVGQYQHDIDPKLLALSLDGVVEDAVNGVGVDVNTASVPLLERVSGLNAKIAANIVQYRNEKGPFKNRKQLNKVPRFGAKTFEQAAGFLRIQNGDTPLDGSAVHPESYSLVQRILKKTDLTIERLLGNSEVLKTLPVTALVDSRFGEPTVRDIIAELEKPGRDPRPAFKTATFQEGVEDIKDLQEGMVLEGVVSNVTNFGAFVDVGVHQVGLVHISAMANRFVKDPHEITKAGEVVKVKVVEVDVKRKRIALTMRLDDKENRAAPIVKKDSSVKFKKPNEKLNNSDESAMAAAFAKLAKPR
ncbi:MAG: RNA-binding transcriptional accessory protein [Magnetococcales bacterium]|nr:RNA-binding transcriptional accessory protein [Magnetococcales bacterium]